MPKDSKKIEKGYTLTVPDVGDFTILEITNLDFATRVHYQTPQGGPRFIINQTTPADKITEQELLVGVAQRFAAILGTSVKYSAKGGYVQGEQALPVEYNHSVARFIPIAPTPSKGEGEKVAQNANKAAKTLRAGEPGENPKG